MEHQQQSPSSTPSLPGNAAASSSSSVATNKPIVDMLMTHPSISKIRLGCDNDGGYVIHCQPGKFSYDGIVVFDISEKKDLAATFDDELLKCHSIEITSSICIERVVVDRPPFAQPNKSSSVGDSVPLPILEKSATFAKLHNAFVRINLGGLEYDIFGSAGSATMSRIKQAVVTINCVQPDSPNVVLQQFSSTHFLAHVHPCNSSSYSYDGSTRNNKVPDTIECTFLRLSDFSDGGYLVRDTATAIPDPILDMPSVPKRPDICMRSTALMGCYCKNNKPMISTIDNISDMLKKAEEAATLKDVKAALKMCCCISVMPRGNIPDVYNNIACGCINLGLFDHARLYLKLALKVDPYNEAVRKNMSACEVRLAAMDHAARYDTKAMDHAFNSIYWMGGVGEEGEKGTTTPPSESVWVTLAAIAVNTHQMYHIVTPFVHMACNSHPEWKELPKMLIRLLHVPEQLNIASKFLENHEASLIPASDLETAMVCIDVYTRFGKIERAENTANTFAGDLADKYNIIGDVQLLCNKVTAAREAYFKGLPESRNLKQVVTLGSCAAMSANLDCSLTLDAVKKLHMQVEQTMLAVIGDEAVKRIRGTTNIWPSATDEIIKVGYILGYAQDSLTPRFLCPLLNNHNESKVEVHLLCMDSPLLYTSFWPLFSKDDKIKTKCKWHDFSNSTCEEIVKSIRAIGVTILVNVCGHSSRGRGRFDLFLFRPAPLQISMIGYSGTSGLTYPQNIDWKIVDYITDPPGLTDSYYTERLFRVQDSSYCYGVPPCTPPPNCLPVTIVDGNDGSSYSSSASSSTGIVDASLSASSSSTSSISPKNATIPFIFGYCDDACKVTTNTLRAWKEILLATPNSCMVIIEDNAIRSSPLCASISVSDALLKLGGIEKRRVVCAPPKMDLAGNLTNIKIMDVMLDAFPCCGTVTVCEALSVGTLVISLIGNSHRTNAAASILINSGFANYVCENEGQYIAKAVDMYNLGHRNDVAREISANMFKKSLVCDGASYAQKIEEAYSKMVFTHLSRH